MDFKAQRSHLYHFLLPLPPNLTPYREGVGFEKAQHLPQLRSLHYHSFI